MLITLITVVHIFVCFFIIVVVLLQSGKAADLAGAFGGAGSQTAFGPRGAATVLSQATTWCAVMFMVCAMALALRSDRSIGQGNSVIYDRAKPATVETALSGERRATGQPARLPAIPPGVEILRKTDEPKPAPAAAAPAAASERARATRQAPVPDALRTFDVQPLIRPAQAPASAPAPRANTLRESASTLQGAGAVGALTSSVAVSDAKERTPEKWLADIRKLKTEGKAIEAERDLVEFKKRYPDYILPEDLR